LLIENVKKMEFLVNMSKSEKRRKEAKKRQKENNTPKWYYDACVLEKRLIYPEITSIKNPKIPIISHLALGEAYGNCLLDKGEEKADNFLKFIKLLKQNNFLYIKGNDGIDKIFNEINSSLDFRLSITDAVHLATAIKHECCIFKTADAKDFKEINKNKIKELGKKYNTPNFAISVIPLSS